MREAVSLGWNTLKNRRARFWFQQQEGDRCLMLICGRTGHLSGRGTWPARNKSGERNVVLLISAKFASAMEDKLGRALLLWLLGVPIPIIILIALLYH
jgi:hypothetical protein